MAQLLGIDAPDFDFRAWLQSAWEFTLPRLVETGLQLVVLLVVYWIARLALGRLEKAVSTRTTTQVDDILARMLRRCVLLSVAFWGLWRLAHIWELSRTADFVVAVWIIAFTLPVAFLLTDLLGLVEQSVVARTETKVDDTALPWINRAVFAVVIGTGVMIGLHEMGINIAPLIGAAGVAGLAVSLAAKDSLANLIAGITIVVDRPFVLGDRIELWRAPANQATWGDVVEIGIRATKIRTPDNIIIIIPNSEIMMRDIINWTAHGDSIRLRIPIGIAYDADATVSKRLCLEAAAACPGVLERPEPVCIIRSFGDSSVNLELRVWLESARDRRAVEDWLTDHIKRIFDREGIEIPYPKRDLYIKTMPGAVPGVAPVALEAPSKPGADPADGGNQGASS